MQVPRCITFAFAKLVFASHACKDYVKYAVTEAAPVQSRQESTGQLCSELPS